MVRTVSPLRAGSRRARAIGQPQVTAALRLPSERVNSPGADPSPTRSRADTGGE